MNSDNRKHKGYKRFSKHLLYADQNDNADREIQLLEQLLTFVIDDSSNGKEIQ